MQILIKAKYEKWIFAILVTTCFNSLYSQSPGKTKYTSVYAHEFKQIKTIAYNSKLITHSAVKPEKNWDSYKGGAINTTDSLFYFNNDLLCFSFPTHADKIRNEYLAFYFAQKSAKCPTLFSLLNYYEPTILEQLERNKLPKELKLLPVVCSAFNPNSSNGIGGEGFWHLNYPQAIKYGLTINGYIDERRDFKKSTKAACNYLKDLYSMYNNWELVLTAYSSGVVNVNKLLQRHSAKTYKEIYPYLPIETKDLVQAFVAMNYIFAYDSYGAVALNPIIEKDTIQIDRKLDFKAIDHVIGIKNKELMFLNPILNREVFPDNFLAYFPKGKGVKFNEFRDSIYYYQDSVLFKPEDMEPKFIIPKDGEPVTYVVKSGDVLGVIAERYNVRVSQIQDWNGLDGTRIDIGQKLTIYGKKESFSPKDSNPKPKKVKDVEKATPKEKDITKKDVRTTYTVKSGDNLWIIAKKFSGVSAQNIMDFNGIGENLNVGQILKIPKK